MLTISSPFALACIEAITPADKDISGPPFVAAKEKSPGASQNIPLSVLNQMLMLAQQRNNDEDIGLLAYQKAHPGNLGVLGYAIMSSATVLDALRHIVEHHSTVGVGFCMFLDEQPSRVRIVGTAAGPLDCALPRVFIDAVTSITLGLLHWLVPAARIVPMSAEFTYAKPEKTHHLEALFGRHITFSATANSLTFQRSDCELRLSTFNPSLQSIHTNQLRMQQREIENGDTTAYIRRIILQHVHQGKPLTMDHVLERTSLTRRQLTNALKKEGTRFQNLLDEVKRQRSCQLLIHSSIALKQIAYTAGFKNQSAFNKACVRWFGMSPGNYRSSGSAPSARVFKADGQV